ncbi:transducin/WD40 repeat-like superfamily protein [Striga asiatica]|uniref:Transducin/WD40 repeat-like superfamily protein n=1 Tax=Striga asiatica TaxID=4170 RepID=A0A5A7Q2Z3_STRAF|nr:transducin/WD40 repeat-like superfamily protein [Striga asiatica]
MGNGDKNDQGFGCKKYGVPLYGAAWVPTASAAVKEDQSSERESPASISRHVVLAGGGGEGHSGIPNSLLLSAFDYESASLSDEPIITAILPLPILLEHSIPYLITSPINTYPLLKEHILLHYPPFMNPPPMSKLCPAVIGRIMLRFLL